MSEIFSDLDNLVVNKNNLWLQYQHLGDDIEEMQDGDWFLNANSTVPDLAATLPPLPRLALADIS
jgi:hypothetical protein